MSSLIGAKLPVTEAGTEPTRDEIKAQLLAQVDFNALLYAEVIDPLGEHGRWAEADVIVAVNDDDIVLAFNTVRISVDDDETVKEFFEGEEQTFFEWAKRVAEWAHGVEGMERWYWFHIHPEGMASASENDERKLSQINAADFHTVGHVGGPRKFQTFSITQRGGIAAMMSDEFNGISPEVDAQSARVFAASYDRTLGVSHPLSEAMNQVATVIEGIAEKKEAANGNTIGELMAMIEGAEALAEAQGTLAEARENVDDDALRAQLKADYVENGRAWPTGEPRKPSLGFAPPIETTNTIDLPQLSPGILSDLASFNFDSLDG